MTLITYPGEKTAVLIDGANTYYAIRRLQIEIDYSSMINYFSRNCRLIRAYYYTALPEAQEFAPIRRLVDFLDYNGFIVITKPMKVYTDASTGQGVRKGNMDIEIAVDAMHLADHVDHIILFSGDGDFRRVVEAVQRKGVRVTVVSSLRTQPSVVADELRRQADRFVDLADLTPILRAPRPHDPRDARTPDDRDTNDREPDEDDDYEDDGEFH